MKSHLVRSWHYYCIGARAAGSMIIRDRVYTWSGLSTASYLSSAMGLGLSWVLIWYNWPEQQWRWLWLIDDSAHGKDIP